MRGAVLVCGTASGVGKSTVVTALCRLLVRRGVTVSPFKAQNMSNQSAVTINGGEIGRAQYAQALAAGVEPETAMNPVLLKPSSETTSQVVVMGRVVGSTTATGYGERTESLLPVVLEALGSLRDRFDVVVAEGAGGAAEINLLDRDIVNLPLADAAGLPAVLVADIDRGGVFASVHGTLELLPERLRRWVRGVVINRFRGDLALLTPGLRQLELRTKVPVLGVLPALPGPVLDEEDSLAFDDARWSGAGSAGGLDVAVVRLPRLANATDVEPLLVEPDVQVRLVASPRQLGRPDLVVLPGTKATVADLAWLRAGGLAGAIDACGAPVLGVCGGYQMLGLTIHDDVESGDGTVTGLGHLPVRTLFHEEKTVRRCVGHALGEAVAGYEIHHGRVEVVGQDAVPWIDTAGNVAGVRSADGRWWGTTVHGLFEHDRFRARFLACVAARAGVAYEPSEVRYAAVRARRHDSLADALERALDMDALFGIIESGALSA